MSTQGRLRWVIFTASVMSSIDNPDAYLWRALGSYLRHAGHEAVFYEPRANSALRALLHRSGAQALTDFRSRHPDIEYRTIETKSGADLVEWMSRTLATADVAVIQSSASPELVRWLGTLTRPHLQTFYLDTGWSAVAAIARDLAETLEGYTAIVAGEDRVAEQYRDAMHDSTILDVGPLPAVSEFDELQPHGTAQLAAVCERLVNVIAATRRAVTTDRGAQSSPNGYHR